MNGKPNIFITVILLLALVLSASAASALPDLIPTSIWYNTDKGKELFANQPNDIRVRINNTGSGDAGAFNVTLEIESYTENTSIPSLAAGAYTFVNFTGYAPTTTGSKKVNVTADKEDVIAESNETNNTRSWTRTVYYNGYKGKRWTDGSDIVTVETYSLKGNITYSVGDSRYAGINWATYTANWSASDLPLPSDAIVQSARLYVSYNWDQTGGVLWGDDTTFNGVTYPRAGASHYSDKKIWGQYGDHAYGFVVYNVTANFNKSGNTVTLGDGIATRTVAIDGMILQVVYSHPDEPVRKIWINEGYDLLMADITKGTDTTETIAYAPFTGGPAIDLANAASARLIVVGPGAGDTSGNKNNVIFNNNSHWDVLPPFKSPTEFGIADIDVTSELGTSNEAAIQDNGDDAGMRAATVILVVEEGAAAPDFSISVSPNSASVVQGSSASATVTLTSILGYDKNVTLGASGILNATISFTPEKGNPTYTSTMLVNTSNTTPVGSHPITITGTGEDGKVHSTVFTLTVTTAKVGAKASVSLGADIMPAVALVVTPNAIDFGELSPGETSGVHTLTLNNTGGYPVSVTAEVNDTASNLFVNGLLLDSNAWGTYSASIASGGSKQAGAALKVPDDYAGVGAKVGTLVFWAQKS